MIIERAIGLAFCPSIALYRSFLKHCTLTNKVTGIIWRDLSKPPQRRQCPYLRPLWLSIGNHSVICVLWLWHFLYSVGPHPVLASIYTLSLCRGHSRLVWLAMQETLTLPGYLVSPLVCRVLECLPWCSIVGATVTVHQFFCILHRAKFQTGGA